MESELGKLVDRYALTKIAMALIRGAIDEAAEAGCVIELNGAPLDRGFKLELKESCGTGPESAAETAPPLRSQALGTERGTETAQSRSDDDCEDGRDDDLSGVELKTCCECGAKRLRLIEGGVCRKCKKKVLTSA